MKIKFTPGERRVADSAGDDIKMSTCIWQPLSMQQDDVFMATYTRGSQGITNGQCGYLMRLMTISADRLLDVAVADDITAGPGLSVHTLTICVKNVLVAILTGKPRCRLVIRHALDCVSTMTIGA